MRALSRFSLCLVLSLFLISTAGQAFGQITPPRASPKQTVKQSVGDAELTIVYSRPNAKGRKLFGAASEKPLEQYGKVWRAGANENTTFEITQNATVNGQKLPKGKYGFHAIPDANEWTVIFNKVNNAWGSFSYKQENDALRVKVKPQNGRFQESLTYLIENVTGNSAVVTLAWGNVRIPFKVDIGDVGARILNSFRSQQASMPLQAANFVLSSKREANYAEAVGWADSVMASTKAGQPGYRRIKYNVGFVKSRLLAAMGKTQEAIALAEQTISFGTAENKKAADSGKRPLFNPNGMNFLANLVKGWKGE